MIAKRYKRQKVFGNEIYEIEGWQEALESEEMYVPHHVLEWLYSSKELCEMNRYDKVSPDELIWLPKSLHDKSKYIHKQKIGFGERLSSKTRGKKKSKEYVEWLRENSSFLKKETQEKATVAKTENLKRRLEAGKRYIKPLKLTSKFVEVFKEHYGEDKLYDESNRPSSLYKKEFRFWNKHNKTPRWKYIKKEIKFSEEHKQKIRDSLKKAWKEGRHNNKSRREVINDERN